MAMQLGALREALLDPGNVPKANRAAEEVAAYDNQFATIKVDLAAIRGELTLVKSMLATVIAISLAIALKIFLR